MVSFYNHFAMYQKNHSANLPYSASPSWYAGNYHHQPPNAQYMGDSDTPPQPVYYPHPHVFHQSSPDWAGHENFAVPPQSSLANGLHLNQQNGEHLTDGLHSIPSPPITVSGSDMSGHSPGAPNNSGSPHINSRPTPVKSPYEWMKKPSYQTQPNPGKTRTKDKYRVVYTDHQRLELEKEFHYTRYITIRRKSELAQALQLSERQVKIWFQNRRAKDRKQKKKIENGSLSNGQSMGGHGQHNPHSSLSNLLDTKPKIEPSLHLQHLHQMGAIGMSMGPMGLHPAAAHHAALHSHHHMGHMPPTHTSQHLSQQSQQTGALSII